MVYQDMIPYIITEKDGKIFLNGEEIKNRSSASEMLPSKNIFKIFKNLFKFEKENIEVLKDVNNNIENYVQKNSGREFAL